MICDSLQLKSVYAAVGQGFRVGVCEEGGWSEDLMARDSGALAVGSSSTRWGEYCGVGSSCSQFAVLEGMVFVCMVCCRDGVYRGRYRGSVYSLEGGNWGVGVEVRA